MLADFNFRLFAIHEQSKSPDWIVPLRRFVQETLVSELLHILSPSSGWELEDD
jgi:hypothetical protein